MNASTSRRDPINGSAHPRRHAGRILLVSDDAAERDIYADYLRLNGFCALEASNAAEAYRIASELRPAVVITDSALGRNRDGISLTGWLMEDARLRRIPVLILSHEIYPPRLLAERIRCDMWVLKPCAPSLLARLIASAIVRSREDPA